MKYLRTSTVETGGGTETTIDNMQDPSMISGQLLNTKQSFRYKKYTRVRISEINTFCPREYALGYLTNSAQESFISFALQQQFDLGSAMHFWLQNYSKVFKDCLYGFWKCVACGNIRKEKDGKLYFGTRPKTNCPHCGAKAAATFYDEFYFRVNSPYRVVGKIDGVIHKDGVYRLCDIKTHYGKAKHELPSGNDMAQIASYALFYDSLPDNIKFPVHVDTSTVYLHYVSKKFSYSDGMLTYPIKPTEKMKEAIKKRVNEFTHAADTGVLPEPFDVCIRGDFKSGKAKDCWMADKCKECYFEGVQQI